MNILKNTYLNDLISLVYPELCISCRTTLNNYEDMLCLGCEASLPYCRFHDYASNPVAKHFWGRVNIEWASSYLYFTKESYVQRMMHSIKYQGRKEIATFLGKAFADEIINIPQLKNVSMIIPVPLHPVKRRRRGFNQAEIIALAMSEVLNIPVVADILVKDYNTSTQTKSSRIARWFNVETNFSVRNAEKLNGKHILIVDDVITTGSTLESCAQTLAEAESELQISIATLTCASHLA